MNNKKRVSVTCGHPDRPNFGLGKCRSCYMRDYRKTYDRRAENHTPEARKRRKTWQEQNRETVRKCIRSAQKFKAFGLTQEEYDEKLRIQGNLCALCRLPFYGKYLKGGDPVLDHSHTGGKVREFLHRVCNTALGQLRDDPKVCRLAAEYLEKHQDK